MDKIHREIFHQWCGFDWNKGNIDKNWLNHKVSPSECEQIFFNQPIVIQDDIIHSKTEMRFYALGQTDMKRFLFIAFTLGNNLIRVISARDMSRTERRVYSDE